MSVGTAYAKTCCFDIKRKLTKRKKSNLIKRATLNGNIYQMKADQIAKYGSVWKVSERSTSLYDRCDLGPKGLRHVRSYDEENNGSTPKLLIEVHREKYAIGRRVLCLPVLVGFTWQGLRPFAR